MPEKNNKKHEHAPEEAYPGFHYIVGFMFSKGGEF